MIRLVATVAFTLVWVSAASLAATPDAAWQQLLALAGSSQRLIEQSSLQLSQRGPVETAGRLDSDYGAQQIEFFSSHAAPDRLSVQLVLNAHVLLEADADPRLGTRELRTGDHVLSIEEKVALQALAAQLEARWRPYQAPLSVHEDLLFRVVSYWAEAPVGWELRSRELSMVDHPSAVRHRNGLFTSGDTGERGIGGCDGAVPPENLSACASGCADSEDDITYWPDACECSERQVCHDTHSFPFVCDHPWCCESVGTGCSIRGECQGRCGGSCGTDGAGVYTWDCADHDRCCRIHGGCFNPLSFACGDEYEEAADDFLFGTSNCTGGCATQPSGACCLASFSCQTMTVAQCQSLGGNWNGPNTACSSCPARPRGDMNCDGVLSVGDIGGFVLALTDPTGYAASFPGCDVTLGDINGDGAVSVGDIGAFVALLTGT